MSSLVGLGLSAGVVVGLLAWWLVESRKRTRRSVEPGYHADLEFSHEEPFELYHNALSLCSMKTRVCLAELGIPYKSHHIDLIETGAYENIRAKLLDVNPGGTVPVLLHHGHPIYESHEQIRYAAQHAPTGAPSLVPDDAALRQEMEEWVDRSSITADPIRNTDRSAGNAVPGLTLPLFCTMVERIPYWRIAEGLLFHFDKMRPMMFMLFKFRGIGKLAGMAPAVKLIGVSRRALEVHLDALEARLEKSGGPWILGDAFTLADVSWLVIFERLRQADTEDVFLGGALRPQTSAYWERLKSRPSYTEAILSQSHPFIEFGTKRIEEAKAENPALRECLEGSTDNG